MANLHVGSLLEKIVKSSDMSIESLTRKLNYSRTTYYNHIRTQNLSLDILIKYGRALGYDFSQDIPEMAEMENVLNARPLSIEEAIRQRESWRAKYFALMEKFNAYLEGIITPKPSPKTPKPPPAPKGSKTPKTPRKPKKRK